MSRTTKFKGEPLELGGAEVKTGATLPSFKVTANDMSDLDNSLLKGKVGIILTMPSLDTPVCSTEAKRFNQEATSLSENIVVLSVSRDLPFAQKRFCTAEGVERAVTASDYKYRSFGENFGALIKDWELLARAVFVVGPDSVVRYVEYVSEVSEEPHYEEALKIARELA